MSTPTYGQRLKAARLALDLTQEQAARRISISTTHWSDLERGARMPSGALARRIRAQFGTLPDDEQRLADAVAAERLRCQQIVIASPIGRAMATQIVDAIAQGGMRDA